MKLKKIILYLFISLSTAPCLANILPVEAFASLPETQGVKLSPDGKRLAMWVNLSNGDEMIVTQTIGSDNITPVLETKNTGKKIYWFKWVNNNQLVVSVRFYSQLFSEVVVNTRLLSVNHDGSQLKSIFKPSDFSRVNHMPTVQDNVIDWLDNDPENFLLQIPYRATDPSVLKINVNTGKKEEVTSPKGFTQSWMTDQQNRVRVGRWSKSDNGYVEVKINLLDLKKNEWFTAWTYQSASEQTVTPLGFSNNPEILYISAYHNGRKAIFKVNTNDKNLKKELVYSHDKYDVDSSLIYHRGNPNPVGINFAIDGKKILWDKREQAFTNKLSKALGGLSVSVVSYSEDHNRYILYADDISSPGMYYFGDKKAKTLSPIAEKYPRLRGEEIPAKQVVHYEARDGLSIEAFLTLPNKKDKNLPTIIFPHGGPFAADDVGFDYWASFFASRGYAVLQMNFRGSSGYGYDFLSAGFGNWGLSMQNDIVDGTNWLIAKGISDKNKVCIVGASYGGYAALLGAAKTPELFKCAVSYAGVTDLLQMYVRSGNSKSFKKFVGTTRQQMKENSPRYLASKMGVPLLIVHADMDSRVDIDQARNLKNALDSEDKDFIYIEQEGGDHFLSDQKHRIEFFEVMDKFLAKYLKN